MARAYLQFGEPPGPLQTVAADRYQPATSTRPARLLYAGRWRSVRTRGLGVLGKSYAWCNVAGERVAVTVEA